MSEIIARQIADAVCAIADPLFSTYQIYRPRATENQFEIKAQRDENPLGMTRVLLVGIVHQHKEIHIPNILIPQELQGHGHGKAMIAAIRDVAERNGYDLFVTDLTQSFHRRLTARGGSVINDEIVQITSSTDLARH